MSDEANIFIKCRCGHSWNEKDVELQKDVVVTANTIDEIRFKIDYKCEKCGRKETASTYVR